MLKNNNNKFFSCENIQNHSSGFNIQSLCTPLMFLSTLMRFCGVKLGLEIISHYNDPLRLSQVERN